MGVRYFLTPGQQSENRFDREMLVALELHLDSLKAEPTRALTAGEAPLWKDFYAVFSKPMYKSLVQVFHGPTQNYVAHPLQWNVLCQPDTIPDQHYDEVWSFSSVDTQRFKALGVSGDKITEFNNFAFTSDVDTAGVELPISLEGEHMVWCSLKNTNDLVNVLNAYLSTMASHTDTMLALHLNVSENASEQAEHDLLAALETVSNDLRLNMEQLNIGSFIGPLSEQAYMAALKSAKALWWPESYLQSAEALSLGKAVAGGAYAASACLSIEELTTPQKHEEGESLAFFEQVSAHLYHLEHTVDFEALAQAYQVKVSAEQEGRKQKYSLFHSDYSPEELKARRNWHANYANAFKDCPGDVLDIGSGSGLFLEIMRDDLCQPAFGIDPDPDMVKVCDKLGVQTIQGDERALRDFQMHSLGGIHASHIIEHVDGDRAIAMVENAFRVLRPGGLLLIRTPNWRNEMVRHEGFWLDITHIRPYPLPLLKQVLQDAGFTITKEGFETFGWHDTYILGQKPHV